MSIPPHLAASFSHPDYTVGTGISPVRRTSPISFHKSGEVRSRAVPPVGIFTLPRRSFKWLVLFSLAGKTACAFIIAQAAVRVKFFSQQHAVHAVSGAAALDSLRPGWTVALDSLRVGRTVFVIRGITKMRLGRRCGAEGSDGKGSALDPRRGFTPFETHCALRLVPAPALTASGRPGPPDGYSARGSSAVQMPPPSPQ